jgi:hypothetical protein
MLSPNKNPVLGLYWVCENLSPCNRPLSIPANKPKSTWAEETIWTINNGITIKKIFFILNSFLTNPGFCVLKFSMILCKFPAMNEFRKNQSNY